MRTEPERPPADITPFNRELAERFGLNRFDEPNLRCVWGDMEQELKHDGTYGLKYHRAWGKAKFKGLRQDGLVLVPEFERHELGINRWIVERYKPPERLPVSDRERFPRGRYVHFYEVETTQVVDGTQGEYRMPGPDTLEHLAGLLAGEAEELKRLDRELQRMIEEEDREMYARDKEAHDAQRRIA